MPDNINRQNTAPVQAMGSRALTLHRTIALALQVIMLVGLGLSLHERQWLNAAAISGIVVLTAVPALMLRRWKIYLPPELELLVFVFIFAALFLGETRGYYGRFWWWDIALHSTSGVLLGVFGFLLVHVLNGIPRLDIRMQPGFVAFFAFCFALAAGAAWEIFEFAMDSLLGMNMQKPFLGDPSGLTDTMWDLIVDALGALAIALSGYVYLKRGMASPIGRWTAQFVAGNPRMFRRN